MFKEARHIYKWFLRIFGYVAIVNPFSLTCHVLPDSYPPSKRLKKHEETHIQQIERDGTFKFCIKYVWYLLIYGYKDNPYEVEARQKAGEKL